MTLFDTSVLVAATIQTHPHHERGRKAVTSVREGQLQGLICQHSIAEFFTTLTRYQLDTPIGPKLALEIITKNLLTHFQIVELGRKDYLEAIERVCRLGLRGPILYDALILQAALKKKAKVLFTFNPSDFQRLSEGGITIRTP